jgi:hypothetical protein
MDNIALGQYNLFRTRQSSCHFILPLNVKTPTGGWFRLATYDIQQLPIPFVPSFIRAHVDSLEDGA